MRAVLIERKSEREKVRESGNVRERVKGTQRGGVEVEKKKRETGRMQR